MLLSCNFGIKVGKCVLLVVLNDVSVDLPKSCKGFTIHGCFQVNLFCCYVMFVQVTDPSFSFFLFAMDQLFKFSFFLSVETSFHCILYVCVC